MRAIPQQRLTGILLALLCMTTPPVPADTSTPPGPFTDAECISCHTERDPDLIKQWRSGPHAAASKVVCSSCHGVQHAGANQKARQDQGCTGCHAGPASHSYSTSKHGVINRIAEGRQDWNQPLQRGNYRAPSCSYCHLHNSNHGDSMAPNHGPELRQWICSGCHSPRYVQAQLGNGKRQLEIADLKLTEGKKLIATAGASKDNVLLKLQQSLAHHRKNILYGVGHQSPDYQWWHGQPALDGDLIRIREAIGKPHPGSPLHTSPPGDSN